MVVVVVYNLASFENDVSSDILSLVIVFIKLPNKVTGHTLFGSSLNAHNRSYTFFSVCWLPKEPLLRFFYLASNIRD